MTKVPTAASRTPSKAQGSAEADLKKTEKAALAQLASKQAAGDKDFANMEKLDPAQKPTLQKAKARFDGQFSTERSALETKFNAALAELEGLNPAPKAPKKPAALTEAAALKVLQQHFGSIVAEDKGPAGHHVFNRADLQAAVSNAKTPGKVKEAAQFLLGHSKDFAATDTAARGGKADGLISLTDLKAEEAKLAKASSPKSKGGSPNQAAYTAARSVLGKNVQNLKYSGPLAKYLDKWPSDTVCCANFVSACQEKAGLMTPAMHTDSVYNLSHELAANKNWKKVSLKDAKPGDVVIMNVPGEGAYGHTVMFAGWKDGKAEFIGSDNVNADGSQRITESTMGYGITAIYQHK